MTYDHTTTLPFVVYRKTAAFTVQEVSENPELHAQVWGWHMRRPGFSIDRDAGPEDCLGPTWRHYCFFFDSIPMVCVSIEEKRPYGYEIHVAAARKTNPVRVRTAVKWIGDLLTWNDCRLASWFPKKHKAAQRLNADFLQYETEIEVDGMVWVRYAGSAEYWRRRHGQAENAEFAV